MRWPLLETLYKFRVGVAVGTAYLVHILYAGSMQPRTCRDGFVPHIYGMVHYFGSNVCTPHGGFATNWSSNSLAFECISIGLFLWVCLAEWKNRALQAAMSPHIADRES
jgi:hypothetical protein